MNDYELYKLLDNSDYEPTRENLDILKEGLEDGTFSIVRGYIIENDEIEIPSDYELYQLLESKGYKTTESNLQILKEFCILNEKTNNTNNKKKNTNNNTNNKKKNNNSNQKLYDVAGNIDDNKKLIDHFEKKRDQHLGAHPSIGVVPADVRNAGIKPDEELMKRQTRPTVDTSSIWGSSGFQSNLRRKR